MIINNKEYELVSPILSSSKAHVSNYKKKLLKEENFKYKKRLILNKPIYSVNKFERDFNDHLQFKKYNKSFNLPEIVNKT